MLTGAANQVVAASNGVKRRSAPRQKTGAELHEELLGLLFDRSTTPMLLADDERRYVAANDAACDALGIERDRLLEMRIEELATPEVRELVASQWTEFLKAGSQSGPYTLQTPDGRSHEVLYSATANVGPGLHLSMFITPEMADPELDLDQGSASDPDRTDQGSTDQKEALNQILSNASTAMLIVNDDRGFVAGNQALLDLLGSTIEELEPMTIDDVIPEDVRPTMTERFERFLEDGSQWGPVQLTTPTGKQVEVVYNGTASIVPGLHLIELLQGSAREPALNFEHGLRVDGQVGTALTTRERQVLSMLALGETNQSIASNLGMAPETVRNHTRAARQKLGARSRSHAIAIAVQTRQLDLDGTGPAG
ncbi:MAG: LuxR C-terminal-related transcriptional regulator [Actinomycetes bacterium]